MARPGSSQRPTHIALPTAQFARGDGSPNGSPAPLASPTSPRSSFLPNFIRNRSRAATITGRASPRTEQADPMVRAAAGTTGGAGLGGTGLSNSQSGLLAGVNGVGRDGGGVTRSVSTPTGGGLINGNGANLAPTISVPAVNGPLIDPKGKTHRIRLVPHLETSRSLAFDPVVREVYPIPTPVNGNPSSTSVLITNLGSLHTGKPPAMVLKIGRFTDKTPAGANEDRPATGIGGATIAISGGGGEVTSGKIAFKSKVVSRTHAEIWCEAGGKFYIRDTSSSSGTFLNHIRLSSPNTDSRPTQLNDGDVLQLGVDYQGGHEDQFRCVKMRVEVGREWQRAANEFNTNALRQLKALGGAPVTPDNKGKGTESSTGSLSKKAKASVTDCCICLFSVTVCQSLFIAPCSHVFHYKCIRPLLMQHHPGFSCPLCRTFANLEEDVEIDDPPEIASRRTSSVSRRQSTHSVRPNRGLDPISPSAAGSNPVNPFTMPAAVEPAAIAGGSTSDDGERMEDDTRQGGADEVDASEDIEMGSESLEAAQPSLIPISGPATSGSTASTAIRGAEARRQAIMASANASSSASRRSSGMGVDPLDTVGIPDIQTPMNEYFLSTLAPGAVPIISERSVDPEGMPSVHQQLDIAENNGQAEGESSRSPGFGLGISNHGQETTLGGGGESDSQVEVEEAVGDQRRREESEMMMFT